MTQRVSAERLAEIKAALAKRTLAALDEREGIQARDYQLAREVDAGLTVGQVLAIIDDLVEMRDQRRVLREALERTQWVFTSYQSVPTGRMCPICSGTSIDGHSQTCAIGNALAATKDGNGTR